MKTVLLIAFLLTACGYKTPPSPAFPAQEGRFQDEVTRRRTIEAAEEKLKQSQITDKVTPKSTPTPNSTPMPVATPQGQKTKDKKKTKRKGKG